MVGKLTGGLAAMAKMRKVTVVHGQRQFIDPTITSSVELGTPAARQTIRFKQCDHRRRLARR